MIRSQVRHIGASLSKKRDFLILGKGVQRSPKGFLSPDERTIYRNDCIQALRLHFPSANMVQLNFYLEGFDKGELFALRNEGKGELGT
jgi:hypothetical protein